MDLLQQSASYFQQYDPDMALPLVAVTLGILGIALPATALFTARKWSESRPDLAGALLGGAIFVSVVSILVAGVITLASMGWLPPPDTWCQLGPKP